MNTSVLLIDDDQDMCEVVQAGLAQRGFDIQWRTTGHDGLTLAMTSEFDAVITDLNLESMSGLEVCSRIAESRPDLPVIVITAFGDMQAAVAAIRAGAYDFINKPLEMEALAHAIERAAQHRRLGTEVKRLREAAAQPAEGVGSLVGQSAAMQRVYELIARLRDTDVSVLLSGESGTGKELVARALHTDSARRDEPFLAINCAAVPAHLLESELFGHVKGAFTDARQTRQGLLEQAGNGTILLDEVGEMPTEMQPKLLRVLQERTLRPVGGNREVPFHARVIAATNRDLEVEVEAGRFRKDLYYRLNVVQIHVPPLRERGNDVLLLAQHFLERASQRVGKNVRGISYEAARKLVDYDWPGNVRQLENWIERAVTLTHHDNIVAQDLPDRPPSESGLRIERSEVEAEQMLTLEELGRRYTERVLRAAEGNKTRAAKILGLDRRTLYRKLERYERRMNANANATR